MLTLSFPGKNAPALHAKLSDVLNTIFISLAEAIKTYKDGEATDAPRITKLVEAGKFDCRTFALRNACMRSHTLFSKLGSVWQQQHHMTVQRGISSVPLE